MIRLNEESGGKKDVSLYQLKVKLKWSKPAIWRRVVVRSDMRLDRLHTVIQVAMGWTNSHLHQFVLGQTFYGQTDPEFGAGMEVLNEKRYRLRDLADGAKKKFIYEYDFGDSWEHELVVEKVLAADPNFKHPVCTGGENACPPEDCGGIHGYYRMLEVIADPKDPEHPEMLEWLGEEWDATYFDLAGTSELLKELKA
jgi:hypothetical protein